MALLVLWTEKRHHCCGADCRRRQRKELLPLLLLVACALGPRAARHKGERGLEDVLSEVEGMPSVSIVGHRRLRSLAGRPILIAGVVLRLRRWCTLTPTFPLKM